MAAMGQQTIVTQHFSHASSPWEESSRIPPKTPSVTTQQTIFAIQACNLQDCPPVVSMNLAQNLDTTTFRDSYMMEWSPRKPPLPPSMGYGAQQI
jgi:hypothetical protein